MKPLATLSMVTKKGHTSTWHFVQTCDGWYAFGGCHRPLVKKLDSCKELRALYKNYLGYGYKPVGKPDEAFTRTMIVADPWDSQLPLDMQQELAALA